MQRILMSQMKRWVEETVKTNLWELLEKHLCKASADSVA